MDAKSDLNMKTRLHLTKEQRLPRCFKDAEKVIKSVKLCQSNFKTVLANSKFRGSYYNKVYTLTLNVLKHYDYIQKIIEEIKLLEKEMLLRREIASILIYEMLFGKGIPQGESKAILTIQRYKNDIMRAHQDLQLNNSTVKVKEIDIPRYARVHTLVTTVSDVIKDLENCGYQQVFYSEDISEEKYLYLIKDLKKGTTFLVDFHFRDLLVFAYNDNVVGLQLYQRGHIFLQDKSSYIPVHVLNPEPSTTVLDACAAPGMKSVHIAAKMKNKGILIACERDKKRFDTLKEMLQCGDVKNSKVFCKDFKLIDPNDQAYSSVDYILVDPSCSGSGMVNRMDYVTDTEDSKNKDRLQKLAGFQIILLKHALKFPSVKRVVYSTCSIHEEENEYVVHEALKSFNYEFKLVSVMPEWSERGSENFEYGHLCLRTVPEKHLSNGFFVAMFERLDGTETFNNTKKHPKHPKHKENRIKSEKNSLQECEDKEDWETNSSLFRKQKKKSRTLESGSAVSETGGNSESKENSKNNSLDEIGDKEDWETNSLSFRKEKQNSCIFESDYKVLETGRKSKKNSERQVIEDPNHSLDSFTKQEDGETLGSEISSKHKKKRKNKEIKAESGCECEVLSQEEDEKRIGSLSNSERLGAAEGVHTYIVNKKSSKHTNSFQTECESSEINESLMKPKKKRKYKYCSEEVSVLSPEEQVKNSESEINSLAEKRMKKRKRDKDNRIDISDEIIEERSSHHKSQQSLSYNSVDNTENSFTKHKKKKKKKHSKDCDEILQKCDKYLEENAIESEIKNKSDCLLESFDCSEIRSRKQKKKKKHELSQLCDDSEKSIADRTTSEKRDKTLKRKEIELEVDCDSYETNCLLSSSDCVENSSRKHKKNKHKKHSKDCINDTYDGIQTNICY